MGMQIADTHAKEAYKIKENKDFRIEGKGK